MANIKNLLASDMDGTVIPLDNHACRAEEIARFTRAMNNAPGLSLAYVTGRDLARALEGIVRCQLPEPDWLICDVGTSLYQPAKGRWIPNESYQAIMRERFGGHTGEDVRIALQGYPEQDASRQTEFKHSYLFPVDTQPETLLPDIKRKLDAAGIHAQLVYSTDVYTNESFLDVLPAGVAKDFAVHFLLNTLGLETRQVVYAGDSGNDEHAFKSGINGIVVANAEAALIERLKIWSDEKNSNHLFFATEPFIAGVHEGCQHFGILTQA